MGGSTKILFSEEELKLLKDSTLFPNKHLITKKVYALLQELAENMKSSNFTKAEFFPDRTDFKRGKISRGENYLEQPWVMLDLPRLFHKESVFAFRTMFWWGNYFSFNFHLAGQALLEHEMSIPKLLNSLEDEKDWFMHSNSEFEWSHELENGYQQFGKAGKPEGEISILKIARKIELTEWEKLPQEGLNFYEKIMEGLVG